MKALDKEVADLSRQLQLVLAESQRKSAATATIPRRGGLTAGSPSFGLTPAGPSGAAVSPAGGNFGITPSGTGGALAALATPARSTLSRPDTPDGVISANLVDFKDVAELQQQNSRLLRAIRRLGEDHEAEVAAKENAAETAVQAALAEVSQLREAAARQEAAVSQLVAQRDLYRSLHENTSQGEAQPSSAYAATLLDEEGLSAATASRVAAEKEAAALRADLDRLKAGTAETEQLLSQQLERSRASEQEARVKLAQAQAGAVVHEAKVRALQERVSSGDVASTEAQTASAALSSQLLQLQGMLKTRSDELLAAQQEAKRAAVAASAAAREKEALEASEGRLRAEMSSQASANSQLQQVRGAPVSRGHASAPPPSPWPLATLPHVSASSPGGRRYRSCSRSFPT